MKEPIKILVELLLAELGLKAEQVTLYNQEFPIPPDERFYINLSILGTKTFGARNKYEKDPVTDELREVQGINRQEMISLLAYSKSAEARERNWEIPLVFSSTLAEQLMEKHSFKIGRVPTSMFDVSEGEGAARINRYNITFLVLAAYQKTKDVEYFDKFATPLIITNP